MKDWKKAFEKMMKKNVGKISTVTGFLTAGINSVQQYSLIVYTHTGMVIVYQSQQIGHLNDIEVMREGRRIVLGFFGINQTSYRQRYQYNSNCLVVYNSYELGGGGVFLKKIW
jgi:hypothetical protein